MYILPCDANCVRSGVRQYAVRGDGEVYMVGVTGNVMAEETGLIISSGGVTVYDAGMVMTNSGQTTAVLDVKVTWEGCVWCRVFV